GRADRRPRAAAGRARARPAREHRVEGRGDPAHRAAPHDRARDLASPLRDGAGTDRLRGHAAGVARQCRGQARMAGGVMKAPDPAETLLKTLGIELVEMRKDRVVARMPVTPRICQPFGLLHGGASVALAETVASTG